MEANEYDLVVIGSGPAGQKGAICAAKMRKKVAIIDRKKTIGGVCVHTGTIPSKTLREAVLYLSGFRQRTFYGRGYVLKDRIAMADLTFRAQSVMLREVEVIKAQLRRNYVTTLEGDARFIDPHTIEVRSDDGSQLVRGHHILIACGTRPAHSADIPIDGKRIFDSDQVHCSGRSAARPGHRRRGNYRAGIRVDVCRAGSESHSARPASHTARLRGPRNRREPLLPVAAVGNGLPAGRKGRFDRTATKPATGCLPSWKAEKTFTARDCSTPSGGRPTAICSISSRRA